MMSSISLSQAMALSLLLILGTSGCGPQAPPQGAGSSARTGPATQASDSKPVATVALEIDFGNGRKKQFVGLPWRESMTAIDVLAAAKEGAGGAPFEMRGSGSSAFVESIDGVSNAGGGEKDRNWLYRVDGQLGTVGAGVVKIKAGQSVLWEYAVRE